MLIQYPAAQPPTLQLVPQPYGVPDETPNVLVIRSEDPPIYGDAIVFQAAYTAQDLWILAGCILVAFLVGRMSIRRQMA